MQGLGLLAGAPAQQAAAGAAGWVGALAGGGGAASAAPAGGGFASVVVGDVEGDITSRAPHQIVRSHQFRGRGAAGRGIAPNRQRGGRPRIPLLRLARRARAVSAAAVAGRAPSATIPAQTHGARGQPGAPHKRQRAACARARTAPRRRGASQHAHAPRNGGTGSTRARTHEQLTRQQASAPRHCPALDGCRWTSCKISQKKPPKSEPFTFPRGGKEHQVRPLSVPKVHPSTCMLSDAC